MPSVSKSQQSFMGMVHALQTGQMKGKDASPEVKKAANSISKKDAKDFASTKRKGLPAHVKSEQLVKEAYEDEDAYEQGIHQSPKDSFQQGIKPSFKVQSATDAMKSSDRTDMGKQRPIEKELDGRVGVIESYNEYGEALRRTKKMRELASNIVRVAETAEMVTMNEAGDWFDKHTVSRNMKEIKKYAGDFSKLAEEADVLHERMTALYDDMGNVLQRYFEIKSPGGEDEMNARQDMRMSAETAMARPYKCNECGEALETKLAERMKFGQGTCPKCGSRHADIDGTIHEIEDVDWFTTRDKKKGTIPRNIQDTKKELSEDSVDTAAEDEKILRDKIARDQKVASRAGDPKQRAAAQKRVDAASQRLRAPKKKVNNDTTGAKPVKEIEITDRFTTKDPEKGTRAWLQQKAEEAQGLIDELGVDENSKRIMLKGILEKLIDRGKQTENAEVSPHNLGPITMTKADYDKNPAGAKVTIGGRKGIVRPAGNNPVKDAGGGTYVQPVVVKDKNKFNEV